MKTQQIRILPGASVMLCKWSPRWIFNSDFPKFFPIHLNGGGRCSKMQNNEECTAVTLRRKLSREGKGGCCDCWHLWPLFICVRGGPASLWLRLPWRGSGGGLPGPARDSGCFSELLPNVTWRGRERRCASAAQRVGAGDLSWLVTWLCTDPWGWQTCWWTGLWLLYVNWKDCDVVCMPTLPAISYTRDWLRRV